jgi:hypothetical protein
MKVLVTAGTVYGKLDDNKLVGNRIRGIWAVKFAAWLHARNHEVTLLLPDTLDKATVNERMGAEYRAHRAPVSALFHRKIHTGYESYAEQCYELAPKVDAAVMAAAVVNWIPKAPFKGKMPTEGFTEGAEQLIPFILVPRVIDRMKKLNPKLTLIGCKMTSGSTTQETLAAAYQTLFKAHCNVVVANDFSDLRQKRLIYPDGHSDIYRADAEICIGDVAGFDRMYSDLEATINDRFYRTEAEPNPKDPPWFEMEAAVKRMERIIEKYRDRFSHPMGTTSRVFGGIAVRVGESGFLVSPREKGRLWTANECVFVSRVDHEAGVTYTFRGNKPSLNAPLMVRMLEMFKHKGDAVLHLHEMLYQTKAPAPGEPLGENQCPTEPYAPPSTFRDNQRPLPRHAFNIEGHGFVAVLNSNDVDAF